MLREFVQFGALASLVVGIMFAPTASRAAHPATRIVFGVQTLEPFGHTRFYSRYPDECPPPIRAARTTDRRRARNGGSSRPSIAK